MVNESYNMTHMLINDYGQRSKSHGKKKPLNKVEKEYQQFSKATKVQSIVITIKLIKKKICSIITYLIIIHIIFNMT